MFFLLYLKLAKVVLAFKKGSKLHYSNYRPISLLSNIKKIIENLCIRDYTPLSITIISVTYSWDLDKNIALINVTENVRKALDDGNIGC